MHHPTDRIAHTTAFCTPGVGALVGTRNSSISPLCRIDPTTHPTMSERSYHGATSRSSLTRILLTLTAPRRYSWATLRTPSAGEKTNTLLTTPRVGSFRHLWLRSITGKSEISWWWIIHDQTTSVTKCPFPVLPTIIRHRQFVQDVLRPANLSQINSTASGQTE